MKDKMVFKLFKTKIVLSLKAKYVDIHDQNVLNVLDSFKKCIQKKQESKRGNCFDRE